MGVRSRPSFLPLVVSSPPPVSPGGSEDRRPRLCGAASPSPPPAAPAPAGPGAKISGKRRMASPGSEPQRRVPGSRGRGGLWVLPRRAPATVLNIHGGAQSAGRRGPRALVPAAARGPTAPAGPPFYSRPELSEADTRHSLVWGQRGLQAGQQYRVRQHTALTELKFPVGVLNQDFSSKPGGNIS